jgi:methyl-accepting chemotaxis protein
MNLKKMFLFIVLITVFGFVINVGICMYSNYSIFTLKNLENETTQLLSSWYKFNLSTNLLMNNNSGGVGASNTRAAPFYNILKKTWLDDSKNFENDLVVLSDMKNNFFIDKETSDRIKGISNVWELTKSNINDLDTALTALLKSDKILEISYYGLGTTYAVRSSNIIDLNTTDLYLLKTITDKATEINLANESFNVLLVNIKKQINTQTQSSVVKTIIISLVFSGLIVIIISLFIMFANARLLKRIKNIENTLQRAADLDLTVKTDFKSNDEISLMGKHLNELIDNILNFIKTVKDSYGKVKSLDDFISTKNFDSIEALEEISKNIESIKQQIHSLDNNLSNSADEADKIGNEINDFSGIIIQLEKSIIESSNSIEKMTNIMSDVENISNKRKTQSELLLKSTKEGEGKIVATNNLIRAISTEIKGILDIISVINGISSQTNILSMNAAIESAHAGESGQGFSVVADEIRKLAESTSQNANSIAVSLKSMVSRINETLVASDVSIKSYENIDKEIRLFVNDLEEITHNIEIISQENSTILNSTNMVKEVSVTIKQSFSNIQNSTSTILDSVKNVKSTSTEVASGINFINSGAKEILKEVSGLNGMSKESRVQMEELNKIISSYKTE